MRRFTCALVGLAVMSMATCATAPEASGPADFTPIAGEPAPPNARLYADCLAQAAAGGAYRRGSDADTEMILFICSGAPAQAFYDALAVRSAAIGSEQAVGGLTYRSTNRVQRDLFGVDYCVSGDPAGPRCVISLNTGDFLTAD